MSLEFHPPPAGLIEAYLNRPSGIQQADQNVHDLMAAYVQAQHEKSKSQTEAIGTLAKLADNVDFSDPNTIKAFGGLFKEAGIKSDVFNPSTPPTSSTTTTPSPMAPTPVEQAAGQSLPMEHPVLPGVSTASPLIQASLQHPDHQIAFGIGGLDPNQMIKTGGGRKKLAAAELALRFQNAADAQMAKNQPQPTFTPEAALAAGTVPPNARVITPPTPHTSDENVTFIGVDAGGNPINQTKKGHMTIFGNPYTGPVYPKSSDVPTAAARNSAESAKNILSQIDKVRQTIAEADKRGLVGPVAGRYFNQLAAGKVGTTGNAENDRLLGKLRAFDTFIKSGALKVHFGARGGQQMYQQFANILNSEKQTPALYNGALDGIQSVLEGYRQGGTIGGGEPSAPSSPKKIGRFTVEVQ